MEAQRKEIIKSLAQMAWADGEVTDEERALLFSTCIQMGASEEEVAELKEALGQVQGDDGASLKGVLPDKASRENVMRAILTMSFIDGALGFAEYDLIEKKGQELELSADELEALRKEALEAAQAFNAR